MNMIISDVIISDMIISDMIISYGHSQVKQVAVARRAELEVFLRELLKMAPEISECDLVYTFFHPLPRDQQVSKNSMDTVELQLIVI